MSGQTCLMKVIVHIGKIRRYCFLTCLGIRVWDSYFVWSVLNSRKKLKHFYRNTLAWQWHTISGEVCAAFFGIGCGTVTPWNESFKSLAVVEKSITGFWDGGKVVEKYLGNKKIVEDQVLLILYWHVFVNYWVVVTTPIHLYLETVIALQFSVADY